VEIEVVAFLFDRSVLFLDDFYDITPNDLQHDTFTQATLGCARALDDTVYTFNCWQSGPGGVPREMTMMVDYPTLSELSRYRLLIWDCDASQNSFTTGLSGAIQNGILDVYLKGGGNLWIYGNELVRGSDPQPLSFSFGTVPEDNTFRAGIPQISASCSGRHHDLGRGDRFPAQRQPAERQFRHSTLDYAREDEHCVRKVEGQASLMSCRTRTWPRDRTRSTSKANYSTSTYHKKACALQFHDLYTGSKVFYMGFPLHTFFEDRVDSLVCYVTDWMSEGL
jgi:hypothetical protein